jgi:protein-disulfide isomerase
MSQARQFSDSLAQLAKRFDLKSLPFSDEELQTLATRARQSFRSEKKREQLDKYKAHLDALYGEERVGTISAALEDINSSIGYEEK